MGPWKDSLLHALRLYTSGTIDFILSLRIQYNIHI